MYASRASETATPRFDPRLDPDQRVTFHGVSWKEFELMLAIRGDQAGVRMTYLEGELELMSPSRSHEGIKTTLARMVEAYAMRQGLVVEGYGSWTLRNAPRERGVEPDECYMVGSATKDRPDLAIEVIWTSGGIDKLEVYRGLDVGEVWMWQHGVIDVFVLRDDVYTKLPASEVLPDFDLALAARCIVDAETQTAAVRMFLEASA